LLDHGQMLCMVDGGIGCLGELSAGVRAACGHLVFGLGDELAGGASR